jgi:hypothetical protein
MLESNNFPSIARTTGLGITMLAFVTLLGSCSRDELAPDCFEPIAGDPGCAIPNPGGTDVSSDCSESMPEGAVGAMYEYNFNSDVSGGTGVYNNWSAITALPPGLTLDQDTGILSGIPEEPGNMAYPVSISVQDANTGEDFTIDCADIVINPRLSANPIRTEPMHCLPHTTSMAEMLDKLEGGDGTAITCSMNDDVGLPCPLGDGNGRPPPGITFNESSCSFSGNINDDHRGTWVWTVKVTQSEYTTYVPFCASNEIDTFHDITLTANNVVESDLQPGLLEYDPSTSISFGNGDYEWEISDPACVNDPSQCNAYGFRYDVTCSPFDPPFSLNAMGANEGMMHGLTATGPTPSASFEHRPWVASFEMLYCTSNSGANCDVDDPNFETNAQTKYHFDVVGYPIP